MQESNHNQAKKDEPKLNSYLNQKSSQIKSEDCSLSDLNQSPINPQMNLFAGQPSTEINMIKIEEPEHPSSQFQSFSEPYRRESRPLASFQSLPSSNNSLSMHLSNLTQAFNKHRIGASQSHQGLSEGNDSKSHPPYPGMNQSLYFPSAPQNDFRLSAPFRPSTHDQSLVRFQHLNRPTSLQDVNTQSHSHSLSSIPNYHQFLQQPQIQKPIIQQNYPQQMPVSPFSNLQGMQFAGLNQMGNTSHNKIATSNFYQNPVEIQKHQHKLIAHHQHQQELQKQQLQSKKEALQQLEKQLDDIRKKRVKSNKLVTEESELTHSKRRSKSLSELSEVKLETTESVPNKMSEGERIDIEEDLPKNPTRQLDVSSITSIEEESATTAFGSKGVSQVSLNTQLEGLTISALDSSKLSQKNPNLSILSLPELPTTEANTDLKNIKMPNSLQMIEEKGEEENSESPERKVPGIYSKEERLEKILQYKKKIMKWRLGHPVNRNFFGRSFVAGSKPRIKGKFVSREEYTRYMENARRQQLQRSYSLSNIFGPKTDSNN